MQTNKILIRIKACALNIGMTNFDTLIGNGFETDDKDMFVYLKTIRESCVIIN